jgi:hypothetical protein
MSSSDGTAAKDTYECLAAVEHHVTMLQSLLSSTGHLAGTMVLGSSCTKLIDQLADQVVQARKQAEQNLQVDVDAVESSSLLASPRLFRRSIVDQIGNQDEDWLMTRASDDRFGAAVLY